VLLSVAAIVWLTYEFWRLLWEPSPRGAMDLRYRHTAIERWFGGRPVFDTPVILDPPATFVLLWPLIGWMTARAASWMWAATTVAALAWTSWLVVRHSLAEGRHERTLMALVPLAIYPSGATIGNGQLGVHVLPLVIASCLLLGRDRRSWGIDLAAALLMLGALVKPSLSAPFLWIALCVPRSTRPALLIGGGYVLATLAAVSFQDAGLVDLLRSALSREAQMAVRDVPGNVANLHIWLSHAGLAAWIGPASLLVFGMTGLWTWRHRRADLWLLIGVIGYASRLWSYHRWYDDGLILLPMVTLFRLARTGDGPARRLAAAVLFAATLAASLAPGGIFLLPPPWNLRYVNAQVVVWIAGLLFLLWTASRERPPTFFLRKT
jgi:hypothetical protein